MATRTRWLPSLAILAAAVFLTASLSAADEAGQGLPGKVLELNKLTGNGPVEGAIKSLTEDADGTKKLLVVAVKMAKDKNKPLNYNAAYVLARVAQDLKDPDACEVFYRYCADEAVKLHSGDKMVQSLGGLIDLYYDQKKFDKTVQLCKEYLEIEGNRTVEALRPAVMERMIQSLARQKKFDEALKLVNNLVKAEDEDKGWWALRLKGWVLREADKPDEAVKAIETVLERIESAKTIDEDRKALLVENNRYFLSNLYIDVKEVDKAAKQLKALLEMKPDDPTYNNDLGYIWADHDMHLDEAEKMIRKALDEDRKERKKLNLKPEDDKDNAAYLDSLGWVLYKQKKYKEAKKWLEEAIKDKDGQHIEILDHLGDVHKALGEKNEAIAVWKKGIESVEKRAGADDLPPSKRELDRKKIVEAKLKDESK